MTFASIASIARRAGLAALALALIALSLPASAQTPAPQPQAQQQINTRERPMVGLTNANDAELLRALQGARGNVTIPDQKAGVLIQPQGRNWRQTMEGTVSALGSWLILGMLAILIAFFLLRGSVKIEQGRSGRLVPRFNAVERIVHWFTASAFIVLA